MSIRITLKKSLIGQKKSRVLTALSLGLKKINRSTIQPDDGSTWGKIEKIGDLVYTEKVHEENR